MPPGPRAEQPDGPRSDMLLFPRKRRSTDRHVLLGVSHSSGDPARHRVFEVAAAYDAARGGWAARAGEQNLNEQRGDWQLVETDGGLAPVFPTAAECLGHAVTAIVAAVDREADGRP